jgi:hypothetical protein
VVFANSYVGQDVDGAVGRGTARGSNKHRVWGVCGPSRPRRERCSGTREGSYSRGGRGVHLDLDQDLQCSPSRAQQPPLPLAVVCVGSHDGRVYAFDASTGALLCTLDLNKGVIFATPVPFETNDAR